jgi:hypothetical protein
VTVGAILTLGLGSFSDVNHVVTLGYGTGASAPSAPPVSLPTGAGNWNNLPKWNKLRRVPTVREFLERERRERQLKARLEFDGLQQPVIQAKPETVFSELSAKSQAELARLTELRRQADAEDILKSLYIRRLILLGLFGG